MICLIPFLFFPSWSVFTPANPLPNSLDLSWQLSQQQGVDDWWTWAQQTEHSPLLTPASPRGSMSPSPASGGPWLVHESWSFQFPGRNLQTTQKKSEREQQGEDPRCWDMARDFALHSPRCGPGMVYFSAAMSQPSCGFKKPLTWGTWVDQP